eukprot:937227-Pyramimonas_sp.AAC.1
MIGLCKAFAYALKRPMHLLCMGPQSVYRVCPNAYCRMKIDLLAAYVQGMRRRTIDRCTSYAYAYRP